MEEKRLPASPAIVWSGGLDQRRLSTVCHRTPPACRSWAFIPLIPGLKACGYRTRTDTLPIDALRLGLAPFTQARSTLDRIKPRAVEQMVPAALLAGSTGGLSPR